MIHRDKNQFIDAINIAVRQTGFRALLLEKDYYLTVILSHISELSDELIFKGGTCLNKIYYAYYRLSEDLDFSMRLQEPVTRGTRRKSMQRIKERIRAFAMQLDMEISDIEKAGRNKNKQYVYHFVYDSALQPTKQAVKFEIGLRSNPIAALQNKPIQHKFIHPFTKAPLFEGGRVTCLSLKEILSEKMRAAALRKAIAPRDFYDLDFVLRNGVNLADEEIIELFKKKIAEDNGDPDLKKYRVNMGRTDAEIKDMRSRIQKELFDVLTLDERENFELDAALLRINNVMNKVSPITRS